MKKNTEMNGRDSLIMEWKKAVNELAKAKQREAELRQRVLMANFDGYDPESLREGTENIELGLGYKLKGTFKISRNFTGGKEAVEAALQKIEKIGSEGQFIADRLVNWKPELSISEYRKLCPKVKAIIDKVIVSKPAVPSLTIVEPKGK